MSILYRGVQMKCNGCAYTPGGSWTDSEEARVVLSAVGWKVGMSDGRLLFDFCRECVRSGKADSLIKTYPARMFPDVGPQPAPTVDGPTAANAAPVG